MTNIGETARELRDSAVDLVRESAGSMSEATAAAQQELGRYAKAGRSYVAREPMTSALVAAAVGAAVAALVMAWRRSHREGQEGPPRS